jgi:hypothetical protein
MPVPVPKTERFSPQNSAAPAARQGRSQEAVFMKKTLVCFASLSILACLIVLPVIRSVNTPLGNHAVSAPRLVSEGNPMPSPLPLTSNYVGTLVAEGNPMPSPIPPTSSYVGILVAEGNPMPSPIPPTSSYLGILIAEGNPMPSPIPPLHASQLA